MLYNEVLVVFQQFFLHLLTILNLGLARDRFDVFLSRIDKSVFPEAHQVLFILLVEVVDNIDVPVA